MQDHDRQVGAERPRAFLRLVLSALFGRHWWPAGGSVGAARALPILAVGVFGVAFLRIGLPRSEPLVELETVEEVDRLSAIHLPLEVNDRVERWMRRFMNQDRRTFEVFLSRESTFAPIIRGKLKERGMPEDLLYLAMIESGFSTRATSHRGAGGVWQFMSPTARQYGLRVDRWIDERRDPVKATDAALDYLQWLHERYDSWYLAAAAYNAGPGRVDRALKRRVGGGTGAEDIYWEIIEHLPRETREYVPKMLAATALAREAGRYGFNVVPERVYEFERVWVPGNTSLAVVAARIGIEPALLRDLNPHLVRGVTPPGTSYGLRVPPGSVGDVVAALGGGGREVSDMRSAD